MILIKEKETHLRQLISTLTAYNVHESVFNAFIVGTTFQGNQKAPVDKIKLYSDRTPAKTEG